MAIVLSNAFKNKLSIIEARMKESDISLDIIDETINSIEQLQEFSILEFLMFENIRLKHDELTKLGKHIAEKYFIHKGEMPERRSRYIYMNNLPKKMSFLLKKKTVYVYDYEDWDVVLEIVRSFL
jgi:hypothetical protein